MKEVFKELDKNEFSNFHDFQGFIENYTRAATARLDAMPWTTGGRWMSGKGPRF